jgi:hypothetical protein
VSGGIWFGKCGLMKELGQLYRFSLFSMSRLSRQHLCVKWGGRLLVNDLSNQLSSIIKRGENHDKAKERETGPTRVNSGRASCRHYTLEPTFLKMKNNV